MRYQPVGLTKDKRINAAFYGVAPSQVDGSVWGSVLGFPGAIVRLSPGENPPETALAEIYGTPLLGYSPCGTDVDHHGVSSGHVWRAGMLPASTGASAKGPSTGRPPRASTVKAGRCIRSPDRNSRT